MGVGFEGSEGEQWKRKEKKERKKKKKKRKIPFKFYWLDFEVFPIDVNSTRKTFFSILKQLFFLV